MFFSLGYNCDIICLQEVDSKIYDLDLEPILNAENYSGYYKSKGDTPEGIAIFYNNTRFKYLLLLIVYIYIYHYINYIFY